MSGRPVFQTHRSFRKTLQTGHALYRKVIETCQGPPVTRFRCPAERALQYNLAREYLVTAVASMRWRC